MGQNPNRDDYDLVFGLPDENTWRRVHMRLDRDDGVVVDIQLLRPIDWIEASGLFPGGEYEVDLPHTSARGIARVLDIAHCPMLANGDGNLVIGRFETRDAKELVKVTFEDGTTLTGTRIHPVWSLDRTDWIELGKLEIGENLQGTDGPVAVQCMTFIATSQPVYNLEIFGEHVYRVGIRGVLCHNTDPDVCTYILKPSIDDALSSGAIRRTTLQRAGVAKSPDHHLFPQELRGEFAKRGFNDIDDFLVRIDQGTHEALHYKLPDQVLKGGFWNNEFLKRMTDMESTLGQLDRRQLLRLGSQMRRDYLPGVKLFRE
ncbi:MAG: polymorphic toxin-type HINT domain-containing protein [Planctomycetota bacterium]|nr:polymorphic toxin-type HINT domain-containing protein [Planctomycetota bacterium]